MKVIGLTGGIGMGKSTMARVIRRLRIPVFDADAAVRAMQAPGGRALELIGSAFAGVVRTGPDGRAMLDRSALRKVALADPDALGRLEGIMHPLVRAREQMFLQAARRRGAPIAVVDIPLLLEARGRDGIDVVVVVSAPPAVQRARVQRRGLLSPVQLDAVLARQWPDARRRRAADRVVRTGLSRHHAQAMIRRIVRDLRRP